jgi:hypothetical protein
MTCCTKVTELEGCHTREDGTRVSVRIHSLHDGTGKPFLTNYLDSAHAIVEGATPENVSIGACPVIPPMVEWTRLCDDFGEQGSVEIMCQVITSFDDAGAPIAPPVTTFYMPDKVTPYVPQGTVAPCPDCPPQADLGVVTSWDAYADALAKQAEVQADLAAAGIAAAA